MKRIHSMFMCTNTKEESTPWFSSTDWQLPEVLWHQPEGGSNPLWAPTHNLLAPSCRPDMFSGTNLKETMIPYGTSPNCPEYKDGSELRPLLETTSNHWLNHSVESLSRSLLITVWTTSDLYTMKNSIVPPHHNLSIIINIYLISSN